MSRCFVATAAERRKALRFKLMFAVQRTVQLQWNGELLPPEFKLSLTGALLQYLSAAYTCTHKMFIVSLLLVSYTLPKRQDVPRKLFKIFRT